MVKVKWINSQYFDLFLRLISTNGNACAFVKNECGQPIALASLPNPYYKKKVKSTDGAC